MALRPIWLAHQPQAALDDLVEVDLVVQDSVVPLGELAQPLDDRLDAVGPLGHVLQQHRDVALEDIVIEPGDLQVLFVLVAYSSRIGRMSFIASWMIDTLPRMKVLGLLISWAMPETSWPSEASLSVCTSCSSMFFCLVIRPGKFQHAVHFPLVVEDG